MQIQAKQLVASQILKAQALLDEIQLDIRSPLHNPKHPRHRQVSQTVADLEAELFRLTCVEEKRTTANENNTKPG